MWQVDSIGIRFWNFEKKDMFYITNHFKKLIFNFWWFFGSVTDFLDSSANLSISDFNYFQAIEMYWSSFTKVGLLLYFINKKYDWMYTF